MPEKSACGSVSGYVCPPHKKQKADNKTVTIGGAVAFLAFGVIYLAEAMYSG